MSHADSEVPVVRSLKTNETDILAALIRAGSAVIPSWGGVVAELVLGALPGQRLDRLVTFVEALAHRLTINELNFEAVCLRLPTPEALFLVEEGLLHAARATPTARVERIARIVADGVTAERQNLDRTLKLLRIHAGLTESEILLLAYYSEHDANRSEATLRIVSEHPHLFLEASALGDNREGAERYAMRRTYLMSLERERLLVRAGDGYSTTYAGRMLLGTDGEVWDRAN